MLNWNLQNTLPNPINDEWDLLVKSCLGDGAHPNRIKGFILSRLALQECLKTAGVHLKISELLLVHHRELLASAQFTISLSHTSQVGAALIDLKEKFISVGIDIEHEEREVKGDVLKRISHPEDLDLKKIELWCLKEAAFKALMNTGRFEKPVEFSSIHIQEKNWLHVTSGIEGHWRLQSKESMLVALTGVRS
jgi:4'-phosphopantetheinyl transferase EntD